MINKRFLISLVCVLSVTTALAGMEDDPLLVKTLVNEFESRDTDGDNPLTWNADIWIGKDLNKLWIKTEGEVVDNETEEFELQLLYSRAVATYWDFQAGWRGDFKPEPNRDWFAVGYLGLAPYFYEVDVAFFIGENGRTAARLDAEYELLFTQRLILTPEIEFNFYGKDDKEVGIGSGLTDIEAGLRLRYEIRREFAPYIGILWRKKFGSTADFSKARGDDVSDTQLVVGIRAWF